MNIKIHESFVSDCAKSCIDFVQKDNFLKLKVAAVAFAVFSSAYVITDSVIISALPVAIALGIYNKEMCGRVYSDLKRIAWEIFHPTAWAEEKVAKNIKETVDETRRLQPILKDKVDRLMNFDKFIFENPEILVLTKVYLNLPFEKSLMKIGGGLFNFEISRVVEEKQTNDANDRLYFTLVKLIRVDSLWERRMDFLIRHPDLKDLIISTWNRKTNPSIKRS